MQSVYSSAFTYVFYMYIIFIAGGLHSCPTMVRGIPGGPSETKNGGLLNLNPFNKTQSHINRTQQRVIARQSSVAVQRLRVVTGAPSRYDHRVSCLLPWVVSDTTTR